MYFIICIYNQISIYHINNRCYRSDITFNSIYKKPDCNWIPSINGWDKIDIESYAILNITIALDNFTKANYTDTINITTIDFGTGIEIYNKPINLSIIVNPQITIDEERYESFEHNKTSTFYYIINNSGNAKLTNTTIAYYPMTMPQDWINTNNSIGDIVEGNYYNLSINATVPEFQVPGNYTGILEINASGESQKTNLIINVKSDGTWYFMPEENQTANFSLNHACGCIT